MFPPTTKVVGFHTTIYMIKYVKHNIDNNGTDYYKIDVTGDITIYKNDEIIGTLQTNCNEEFLNELKEHIDLFSFRSKVLATFGSVYLVEANDKYFIFDNDNKIELTAEDLNSAMLIFNGYILH